MKWLFLVFRVSSWSRAYVWNIKMITFSFYNWKFLSFAIISLALLCLFSKNIKSICSSNFNKNSRQKLWKSPLWPLSQEPENAFLEFPTKRCFWVKFSKTPFLFTVKFYRMCVPVFRCAYLIKVKHFTLIFLSPVGALA